MSLQRFDDITQRRVKVIGITDIMFDRYAGDNKTQLPPESKMYFMPDNRTLCLPMTNVQSFLSAKNTTSAAKLIGGKAYKATADALLSYVTINPYHIPLTRNGAPIVFSRFTNGRDEKAGVYIHRAVARLDKGIPNPKERPTIELPWELEFSLCLLKNDVVDETLLQMAFIKGGIALGFGTFRGAFGKFFVEVWE